MKSHWFCGVEGQQYGPFTWEQMRAMAVEGRLVRDSFVRRDIDQQWLTAAQIPGLLPKKKSASGGAKSSDSTASQSAIGQVEPGPQPPAAPAQAPVVKTKSKVQPVVGPGVGPVPVGQAVAATAALAGAAIPAGVAVGASVAVPEAPSGPSFVFSPSPVSHRHTDDDDDDRPAGKKKNNPWLLVGILGGTAATVAGIGIALMVMSMSSKPESDKGKNVAAMDPAAQSEVAPLPARESNPAGEANPIAPAAASSAQSSGSKPPVAGGADVAAKIIASQPEWKSILAIRAIKLNSVSLQVTSAWLASDAKGTRVEPAVPLAAAVPIAATELAVAETPPAGGETPVAPAATPEPAALAAPPKYVFVEVKVSNGSPVPKKYVSWNGAEATAAVLADQTNQVLTPVPPSATPGVSRLGIVQLAPNQTVTDLLVFTAPSQPVESLKLALVKTALADAAKGHWAFEIPLEALFAKAAPAAGQPQPAGEGPISASRQPTPDNVLPAIIDNTPAKPEEPAPAPAAGPAQPKRPPTIEELNKQFEELDKQKKAEMEKDAPPAAAKPQGAQ